LFGADHYQLWVTVTGLYYAFPTLVFFYFAISQAVTVCTLQAQSLRVQHQRVRRDVILALVLVAAGAYVSEPTAAYGGTTKLLPL
jgi:predicted metal-binding membrane protein